MYSVSQSSYVIQIYQITEELNNLEIAYSHYTFFHPDTRVSFHLGFKLLIITNNISTTYRMVPSIT